MIARKVHIRNWDIRFFFSFDENSVESITDALVWAVAPNSIVTRVLESVLSGRPDEGFCFSNPSIRRTVAGIGLTTSGPEVLNSTVHEIVHIAQHISEEDEIDPESEEFAYLCGDISSAVSDIVCELSCPHCRPK